MARAVFFRSHGLTTGQIGTWLTLAAAFSGLLGTWLVVRWSSWPAVHKEARQRAAMAVALGVGALLTTLVCLAPNAYWAFAFMALAGVGLTTTNGPLIATIQTLVPEDMRAVAFALIFLCGNLIGAGFGPLLSGALSDAIRPWGGEELLRYALLTISPGYFWAAWHARCASKLVAHDCAAVPRENDAGRDELDRN